MATTDGEDARRMRRMAGGWVKFEKTIETDPRVLRMARSLGKRYTLCDNSDVTQERYISNAAALPVVTLVCGALVRLWCYADTHIRSDDVLDLGPDEIDALVGIPGFATACPDDWLRVIDAEHVELPNFQAHNGTEARRIALTQKRVAKHRAQAVTHERYSSNAEALPDLDLDLDKTKKKKKKKEPLSSADEPPTALEPDPVAEVFEHWRTTMGKNAAAKLDAKRRKLIAKAIKGYGIEQTKDAIAGYLNSPHHMGRNANGVRYDSIDLLLRDTAHVEAGLALFANPPTPQSIGPPSKAEQITRRAQEAHRRGCERFGDGDAATRVPRVFSPDPDDEFAVLPPGDH